MKFEEILDQPKQSIDVNKYEQPIVTLVTDFLKPTGKVNPYVLFV